MYDRILLPTDGSDAGVEVSLRHAIAQAQAFGATLHILYVTDSDISDSSSFMGEKSPAGKGATKRVKDRAEERGVKTETAVVQGEPEEEIVDYARKQAIDLIVMGTHGRTGISRVLEGSVTEEVVRKSRKPVLAVERKD
jgi:nucleotide-binding universal stress UspA family protein